MFFFEEGAWVSNSEEMQDVLNASDQICAFRCPVPYLVGLVVFGRFCDLKLSSMQSWAVTNSFQKTQWLWPIGHRLATTNLGTTMAPRRCKFSRLIAVGPVYVKQQGLWNRRNCEGLRMSRRNPVDDLLAESRTWTLVGMGCCENLSLESPHREQQGLCTVPKKSVDLNCVSHICSPCSDMKWDDEYPLCSF